MCKPHRTVRALYLYAAFNLMFLGIAAPALAKGGELGLLERRTAALVHPAMMFFLLGASCYAGFLGFQVSQHTIARFWYLVCAWVRAGVGLTVWRSCVLGIVACCPFHNNRNRCVQAGSLSSLHSVHWVRFFATLRPLGCFGGCSQGSTFVGFRDGQLAPPRSRPCESTEQPLRSE